MQKREKHILCLCFKREGFVGSNMGISFPEDDFNTVYGIYFGHESETPGLGANISTSKFQAMFRGKKLFENSQFVSIRVNACVRVILAILYDIRLT